MIWQWAAAILAAYLIGTVNPSYLIARHRGFDIRSRGSGNAGGSNALITMGRGIGVLCMLFDIAKACFLVLAVRALLGDATLLFALVAAAVTAGHCFPFYLRFQGGKGFACLAGCVLGWSWQVFLILFAVTAAVVLITRYLCFAPMVDSFLFAVIVAWLTHDLAAAGVLLVLCGMIVLRHRENLRRIRAGTEMRFRYLWDKKTEQDRAAGKINGE